MYETLYRHLVQHRELPLPGIGTFRLTREPAVIDFPNKKIFPPAYSIRLDRDSYIPGAAFFNSLADSLSVSSREAVYRFNDFAFDLKKLISEGSVVKWNGVGQLSKGFTGEIIFQAAIIATEEKPVMAEKIIRERAEHTVRVGENERSAEEMQELLAKEENKKISWWVFAMAIAVPALMFIGWYLSENGLEIFSIANNERLKTVEAGGNFYKIIQ